MADEKTSPLMKQTKLLTALVALLLLVAGAAYEFGIKEATLEQKIEQAKENEKELQRQLNEIRGHRQGYERQWMEQRPLPQRFSNPAKKR